MLNLLIVGGGLVNFAAVVVLQMAEEFHLSLPPPTMSQLILSTAFCDGAAHSGMVDLVLLDMSCGLDTVWSRNLTVR